MNQKNKSTKQKQEQQQQQKPTKLTNQQTNRLLQLDTTNRRTSDLA
jgi:hypothetical protein